MLASFASVCSADDLVCEVAPAYSALNSRSTQRRYTHLSQAVSGRFELEASLRTQSGYTPHALPATAC